MSRILKYNYRNWLKTVQNDHEINSKLMLLLLNVEYR